MRTFKQYLNALEKQRKLEKTISPKDGVMPVYVHGKHAAESTDNSFPNYVHGKHASNKINEKAQDDNIVPFGDNVLDTLEDESSSSKSQRRTPKRKSSDTGEEEPTDLRKWFDQHNKNVNDGQGLDSLHEDLKKHYHEDLSNHPDSNHVVDYTKGSGELNRALLRSHKSGASEIEPVDNGYSYTSEKTAMSLNDRRNGIDKAITATPAPKDFDTFSGIGFDPRRIMDENNVIHSPAYLSSSIDPRIAHSFSQEMDPKTGESPRDFGSEVEKHILRIPVKQYQTNGAYVDSISNFGTKDGQLGEREFLHPRGQKYKIDPTPKTLTSKYGGPTHIWTATPIED